jgi:hypothetical protein
MRLLSFRGKVAAAKLVLVFEEYSRLLTVR